MKLIETKKILGYWDIKMNLIEILNDALLMPYALSTCQLIKNEID